MTTEPDTCIGISTKSAQTFHPGESHRGHRPPMRSAADASTWGGAPHATGGAQAVVLRVTEDGPFVLPLSRTLV